MWTPENIEKLQACFEITDWSVFFESCSDKEELTDTIVSYIQFCEDSVIETKRVKVFPNNKPWVSKDLRRQMIEKKKAFKDGNLIRVKELMKEFRSEIRQAKINYKDKVEENLRVGNAKDAWKGLNLMMGKNQKKNKINTEDPVAFANELNQFYARFDVHDFKKECDLTCQRLTPTSLNIKEEEVVRCFLTLNPSKASGPDGLKGRVFKTCSYQLSYVFTRLFQLFLNTHFVPRSWKLSTVIPVPKKPYPKRLNDYRPVALTSILAKCMERLVCNKLMASVADRLDPLQFAYKPKRGVEDASLTLINLIAAHLEHPTNYVRILFMDFSSAFNTIQPHLLIKRLLDLDVNHTIILWIRQFLSDRPQRVILNGTMSNELTLNTGAPQGCVLSPILFSIYTNEIMLSDNILTLLKFADDMALVARLKGEVTLSSYFPEISRLCAWFNDSFLTLNVNKTKELILNNGKKLEKIEHVTIGN